MPFPFLKLPGELRNQIYRLCLPQSEQLDIIQGSSAYHPRGYRTTFSYNDPNEATTPNMLSILGVCHKTYMEAMPILYHNNLWTFGSLKALESFLHQIGPKSRQHLSYITIWYLLNECSGDKDECFTMLASCAGLSHLRLAFSEEVVIASFRYGRFIEPAGMEALRSSIRVLKALVVVPIMKSGAVRHLKLSGYSDKAHRFTTYMKALEHDLMRPKVQESERWHSSGTTFETTLQTRHGRWLSLNGPTFCTRGLDSM